MPARIRLGELLVDAQIIGRQDLEEVLAHQKTDRRRLGTLLVEAGLVTETQVTQILSQQLSIPWVSLYHVDFSRQLLNLVPRETAEKYCLVPIFVRRVRGVGDALYVAMDDPSDEAAQRDVAQYSGLPVRAMIAPPSDIRAAIRAYYQDSKHPGTEAGAQAPGQAPTSPQPPPLPTRRSKRAPPRTKAVEKPPSAPPLPPAPPPPPEGDAEVEPREEGMPAPKRGSKRRMVTVTLLDGTRINLPARSRREPTDRSPAAEDELTAHDLVAALRAVSHGADASEILGEDARWEPLLAALLAVLLKKHLIADWELVEELKRG